MIPTIGRIVHYVSHGTPGGEYGKECRAAIVTDNDVVLDEMTVSLAILNPTGVFFAIKARNQVCPVNDGGYEPHICPGRQNDGGTWHYQHHV